MQPSPEYQAAPDVSKSREEKSFGQLRVVLENYSTKERLEGVSTIFVSRDGGKTFAPIGWKLSWLDRAGLLIRGRSWPPDHCHLKSIDDAAIEMSYIDQLDASEAKVFAVRYFFQDQRWRV